MAKGTNERKDIPKKYHRLQKLVKVAALAGAVYGAKKLWDKRRSNTSLRHKSSGKAV